MLGVSSPLDKRGLWDNIAKEKEEKLLTNQETKVILQKSLETHIIYNSTHKIWNIKNIFTFK